MNLLPIRQLMCGSRGQSAGLAGGRFGPVNEKTKHDCVLRIFSGTERPSPGLLGRSFHWWVAQRGGLLRCTFMHHSRSWVREAWVDLRDLSHLLVEQ